MPGELLANVSKLTSMLLYMCQFIRGESPYVVSIHIYQKGRGDFWISA